MEARKATIQPLLDHYAKFREEDRMFLLLSTFILSKQEMEKIERSYDLSDEYENHPATHKWRCWIDQGEDAMVAEIKRIPLLVEFFGERLSSVKNSNELRDLLVPLRDLYARSGNCYADIYSRDICAMEDGRKYLIMLTGQQGEYLGHIYGSHLLGNKVKYIEFIGIRESLRCTLEKLYGNKSKYSGIAFSLLDACKEYGKSLGASKITLAAPIGRMIHIAERYGFVMDELYI